MNQAFDVRSVSNPVALAFPFIVLALAVAGVLVGGINGQWKILWTVPLLLLAAVFVAWSLRRLRVTLEAGMLTVAAGFNTRRVAVSGLVIDAARIIDLREHTEYRPRWKLAGGRLPGYYTGHFLLQDRRRAFALVTDPSRVVMLPETSGRILLLSLQQPQSFLDALRRAVAGRILQR